MIARFVTGSEAMQQAWDVQWQMLDRLGDSAQSYKGRIWLVGFLDFLNRIKWDMEQSRDIFREHGYVATVCNSDAMMNYIHN